MMHIKKHILVNAPAELVWQKLAKLDEIHVFVQGISNSVYSSKIRAGIGAQRTCYIDGVGSLVENIVEWNEGSGFKYEVAGMPSIIRKLSNTWSVHNVGEQTAVGSEIEVQAKYGWLGWLLERLALRARLGAGSAGALAQFKYYVEEGMPFTGNVGDLSNSLPSQQLPLEEAI